MGSCIIKRFCEGRFVTRYISTIGIDYGVKELTALGRTVKVNFFDLAGSEDFEPIRTQFYENSSGGLCVFDVTNAATFREIPTWIDEARRNGTWIRKGRVGSRRRSTGWRTSRRPPPPAGGCPTRSSGSATSPSTTSSSSAGSSASIRWGRVAGRRVVRDTVTSSGHRRSGLGRPYRCAGADLSQRAA